MKAYITGKLSKKQPDFHLTNLWFAKDEVVDTDIPSIDCLGLSCDGFDCETIVNGNQFSSRWKEVYLTDVDEYGSAYQTRLFGIKQLILMIERGDMYLRNIEAFAEGSVTVEITEIKLIDEEGSVILDKALHSEPIEFID